MRGSRAFLSVFVFFVLALFLSSCAHIESIAEVGAAVGVASGRLSEEQAGQIVQGGAAAGRLRDARERAIEEITAEQEYYIGRAVAANILTRYRLQTNTPALTAYLNRICNALVVNSPRPEIFAGYRVAILDADEINAFATPGGHIFITRGLLESTTSEDTLAAVIAHEIAHIQLEHGLRAIRNSRNRDVFRVLATEAGGLIGVSELVDIFNSTVGEVVNTLLVNGYSREQELEADTEAMALLALAGYEPSALIDVLRLLQNNQPGRRGGFNNTHPAPAQRITNAQATVNNFNVTDTRSYRLARYRAVR
jgi:predicted Zn-dependent protease